MTTTEQPTRKRTDDRGPRDFDKTSLHEATHGRWVHRDYAAHYFRWGFAGRFAKRAAILDIGCGPELPFMRVVYGTPSLNMVPKRYVGVDLNKITRKPQRDCMIILDETDFTSAEGYVACEDLGPYDLITCFEVIEHMQQASGATLLNNARSLLAEDGVFLLSTPVYDGKARAFNHIHEYPVDELRDAIEAAGLKVVRRFGTFASVPALKKAVTPEQRTLMEELAAYYSYDVLSCFLSPLYPDACRNNVWQLAQA